MIAANRGCAQFANARADFVWIRPVAYHVAQTNYTLPAPFRRFEGGFQGRQIGMEIAEN
jgi:hypothetical protein